MINSKNSTSFDEEFFLINKNIIEFFGEDLDFLGYFGSRAIGTSSSYSDIDFIILLNIKLNQDEIEKFSPILKEQLSQKGLQSLSAFNIYYTADFLNSPNWFKIILSNNLKSIYDKIDYKSCVDISSIGYNKVENKEKIWKISKEENRIDLIERFQFIAGKLKKRMEVLSDSEFKEYYLLESERIDGIIELLDSGFFCSISSFQEMSKYVQKFSQLRYREKDYKIHFLREKIFFHYEYAQKNYDISKELEGKDIIGQLTHLLFACHIIMREVLHKNNYFIIDGELTQAFFKKNHHHFDKETFFDLIKAEQIIGRSGLLTFDLNGNKPFFAEQESQLILENLISKLKVIYSNLIDFNNSYENAGNTPIVSIIIPSYNRLNKLKDGLKYLNQLVFPVEQLEILIVDDGSDYKYDINEFKTKFHLNIINKDHSGVTDTKNKGIEKARGDFIMFLDDDINISPLALLKMLGTGMDSTNGITGVTVNGVPEKGFIQEYIHYRGLLSGPIKNKNGDILNVPSCCTLIRKKIFDIIGGFSERQGKEGIPFGGEDVDISYRVKNAGFSLSHNSKALVYHKHRDSLKELITQHIGYGQGTAFHCIEQKRDFSELGIPIPTYISVSEDILKYMILEIPKRIFLLAQERQGISKIIGYPLLDLTRRVSYDIGVLMTKKLYFNNKT